MDEYELGFIEINDSVLARVIQYGEELRRIKTGVRSLAGEVDALDVPGASVLASQLLELIDPLQYLQPATILQDNDNPTEDDRHEP